MTVKNACESPAHQVVALGTRTLDLLHVAAACGCQGVYCEGGEATEADVIRNETEK